MHNDDACPLRPQLFLLLVSDSERLRKLIPNLLSTTNMTVLTSSKVYLHHVMTQYSKVNTGPAGSDYKRALQSSVAEHWLLSLADMHVLSFNSGFGRTAAALGNHEHAYIYMRGTHFHHEHFRHRYRTCLPSHSLTIHDLARRPPGI